MWVCVPEISRLCFHPFSVITCPAADPSWNSCILLQSKITGTWTKVCSLCHPAPCVLSGSCLSHVICGPPVVAA